jgi:hypothetical protein
MPQVLVRNLDGSVIKKLKEQALRNAGDRRR